MAGNYKHFVCLSRKNALAVLSLNKHNWCGEQALGYLQLSQCPGLLALTRARGDSPSRIPASVPGINGYEKMSVFFKRKWFLRTLLPDSPKETYS